MTPTADINIYKPNAPLNDAEKAFLALHALEVRRFSEWMVYVERPDGRTLLLDRTLSFKHWSLQLKGQTLSYNGTVIPDAQL